MQIINDFDYVDPDNCILLHIYDIYENSISGFLTTKKTNIEMVTRAFNAVYGINNKYINISYLSAEEKNNIPTNPLFDVKKDEGFVVKIGDKPIAWIYI